MTATDEDLCQEVSKAVHQLIQKICEAEKAGLSVSINGLDRMSSFYSRPLLKVHRHFRGNVAAKLLLTQNFMRVL